MLSLGLTYDLWPCLPLVVIIVRCVPYDLLCRGFHNTNSVSTSDGRAGVLPSLLWSRDESLIAASLRKIGVHMLVVRRYRDWDRCAHRDVTSLLHLSCGIPLRMGPVLEARSLMRPHSMAGSAFTRVLLYRQMETAPWSSQETWVLSVMNAIVFYHCYHHCRHHYERTVPILFSPTTFCVSSI